MYINLILNQGPFYFCNNPLFHIVLLQNINVDSGPDPALPTTCRLHATIKCAFEKCHNTDVAINLSYLYRHIDLYIDIRVLK